MSEANQKKTFLASEGDEYYQRNKDRLSALGRAATSDQAIAGIQALGVRPRAILEVGCSNGWRLEALREWSGAACFGIDPSAAAIREGQTGFPRLTLAQGTADALPFDDGRFDLVIFGFCLYLCDRKDLFKIACEADRVLQDLGHLAVYDFHPPFPYRNPYRHHAGLYSFKMDYSRLFAWNPAYTVVARQIVNHDGGADVDDPDGRVSVSLLRKSVQHAYPDNPYVPHRVV